MPVNCGSQFLTWSLGLSEKAVMGSHHDPGLLAAKVKPRLEVGRVREATGVKSVGLDMEGLELGRKPRMTTRGKGVVLFLGVGRVGAH